jgi:hypothetical protein
MHALSFHLPAACMFYLPCRVDACRLVRYAGGVGLDHLQTRSVVAGWCGRLVGMALLGAAMTAGAQVTAGAMGSQQSSLAASQSIIASMMTPVTGTPYQATKVTKSVQTLSDGTVITHETRGLIARDGDGRVREDLYQIGFGQVDGHEQDRSLESSTVGDPVSHTILFWTGQDTKIAMQMQLPNLNMAAGQRPGMDVMLSAPPPPPPPPSSPSGAVRPGNLPPGAAGTPADAVHTDSLGQQSLDGMMVTGKRITTTIPLGKIGNDRPIQIVHEEWRSPELKILVRTVDSDPRTGTQTMDLEGVERIDPKESLFHAPAGYKVQDMASMFKMLGSMGRNPTP